MGRLPQVLGSCRMIGRALNSKAIRAGLTSVLWGRGRYWRGRREGELGAKGGIRRQELLSQTLLEGAGGAEKPQA